MTPMDVSVIQPCQAAPSTQQNQPTAAVGVGDGNSGRAERGCKLGGTVKHACKELGECV